jgi:hypothetical protein
MYSFAGPKVAVRGRIGPAEYYQPLDRDACCWLGAGLNETAVDGADDVPVPKSVFIDYQQTSTTYTILDPDHEPDLATP